MGAGQWSFAMRHLLIVALLVSLSLAPVQAGQFNAVVEIGDSLPEFTDLPATDGARYSSSDFDQEVLVLVSLANHCPWVRGMDAGLIELAAQFQGRSVGVVAFAVNHRQEDRLPAMIEHAREAGYNFVYVYDDSQQLGRALGATRTPEYFVFDRERKLAYTGLLTDSPARMTRDGQVMFTNGEPTQFYVRNAIDALLAGQRPDPAETRAQGCSVEYEQAE